MDGGMDGAQGSTVAGTTPTRPPIELFIELGPIMRSDSVDDQAFLKCCHPRKTVSPFINSTPRWQYHFFDDTANNCRLTGHSFFVVEEYRQLESVFSIRDSSSSHSAPSRGQLGLPKPVWCFGTSHNTKSLTAFQTITLAPLCAVHLQLDTFLCRLTLQQEQSSRAHHGPRAGMKDFTLSHTHTHTHTHHTDARISGASPSHLQKHADLFTKEDGWRTSSSVE